MSIMKNILVLSVPKYCFIGLIIMLSIQQSQTNPFPRSVSVDVRRNGKPVINCVTLYTKLPYGYWKHMCGRRMNVLDKREMVSADSEISPRRLASLNMRSNQEKLRLLNLIKNDLQYRR